MAAVCSLLAACNTEQWKFSALSRKPDFDIRPANEFYTGAAPSRLTTNGILYLEAGANLYDYVYDSRTHSLEISLEVNRDDTITVSGASAGAGKRLRLLNLRQLSRAIRLKDSTRSVRLGASAIVPPDQRSGEEQSLTLLLRLSIDPPGPIVTNSLARSEFCATLRSLVMYDHHRDLVVAEWTREPEEKPPKESPEP
jgi:hypothetical protein